MRNEQSAHVRAASTGRLLLLAALAAAAGGARAGDEQRQPEYVTFTDSIRMQFPGEPTLRFDKTGPNATYSWQVVSDELGMFFEEVSDASRRRLIIGSHFTPSVLPSMLYIGEDGVQISSGGGPSQPTLFHVYSNDPGTFRTRARIEEGSTTVASRNMLRIVNNGASTFRFDNSATGSAWGFGSLGSGNFFIGASPGQPLAFTLTPAGDLTIMGALTQSSDRNAKHDIVPVDPEVMLARLGALPVSSWSYLGSDVRHVGPMAQDFAAAFHLGADDTHLAPADLAGVGLAAVQALDHKLEREASEREARILELERRLAALEARLGPS